MPFSPRPILLNDTAAAVAAVAWRAGALAALAASIAVPVFAIEFQPRVGLEFEHFGQSYRVTDEEDTVTTIDDGGTTLGVTMLAGGRGNTRLRAESGATIGLQSVRARLAVQAELRRGANLFLADEDATMRRFRDGGDYSLSSDSFQGNARFAWERALDAATSLRIQNMFELVHYADPDEYNLNSFLHRPGIAIRRSIGLGGWARAAYHLGLRDVPDSTVLRSVRHTGELDVGGFLGQFASADVAGRVERRIYDSPSPRESSWETRADATIEGLGPGRFGWRLRPELETVRYDAPDDLDFDFTRLRVAAGPVVRLSPDFDLSFAPSVEVFGSETAPDEEYDQFGVECGAEWRGRRLWINITDEVGRRDYAREATNEDIDFASTDAALSSSEEGLYSDSMTNRLTVLVSAEIAGSTYLRLFLNWEPEDHRLDRDDAVTSLVSGGLEYRF